MKKCMLFIFSILLSVVAISGCSTATNSKSANAPAESISIIEDAEQFSRINTDELTSIMGEPGSKEEWTLKTSKGDFEVTTFSYEKKFKSL